MSTNIPPSGAANLPPVALIAGPTASGKSDVAVQLALALENSGKRAVVINADSAQVYADLAVLSARPSAQDMRGVTHRLFGTWDGALACSAANWAAEAKQEITDVHSIGGVPILVGGTGLYLRTLIDGIAPVPEIEPTIREQVRSLPTDQAYAALFTEDPQAASRLNPNDTTRIARALEVVRSTGKTLATWQGQLTQGIGREVSLYPLIMLPERAALYDRCNLRFESMLADGAIGEVEALLTRKLDPALPVMRAIGVREINAMLTGELTKEAATALGQQATRNYAKRQYTWFKGQSQSDWHRMESFKPKFMDIFDILLHK